MSDDDRGDSGFLARWSRRKREVEQEAAPEQDKDAALSPAASASGELSEAERQRIVAQLPDVDSLDANSDFTAFLREGVPAELRERALRKLWRLDPVFANLDGLNDYDLDYTNAATVVENLKSAWRAGKGYARDDDARAPEKGRASQTADEPAPDVTGETPAEPAPEVTAASPTAADRRDDDDAATGSAGPEDKAPAPPSSSPASASRKPSGSAARRRWG